MAVFEERIILETEDGLNLEARLGYDPDLPDLPDLSDLPASESVGAAVVCPPHPLYGGDMDNNVVVAVAHRLARSGLKVIRFNYRGVGTSECERPDLPIIEYWGALEATGKYTPAVRDVRAAARQAVRLGGSIWFVGYSLGSVLALRVAAEYGESLSGYVGIAAPVHVEDFSDLKKMPRYLILLGGRDELFPTGETTKAFERFGGSGRLVVIEGSDHFFIGTEDRVAGEVASFIA